MGLRNVIISSSRDKTVMVWELTPQEDEPGYARKCLTGHNQAVQDVVIFPHSFPHSHKDGLIYCILSKHKLTERKDHVISQFFDIWRMHEIACRRRAEKHQDLYGEQRRVSK